VIKIIEWTNFSYSVHYSEVCNKIITLDRKPKVLINLRLMATTLSQSEVTLQMQGKLCLLDVEVIAFFIA
jgi:hypothetical protein